MCMWDLQVGLITSWSFPPPDDFLVKIINAGWKIFNFISHGKKNGWDLRKINGKRAKSRRLLLYTFTEFLSLSWLFGNIHPWEMAYLQLGGSMGNAQYEYWIWVGLNMLRSGPIEPSWFGLEFVQVTWSWNRLSWVDSESAWVKRSIGGHSIYSPAHGPIRLNDTIWIEDCSLLPNFITYKTHNPISLKHTFFFFFLSIQMVLHIGTCGSERRNR